MTREFAVFLRESKVISFILYEVEGKKRWRSIGRHLLVSSRQSIGWLEDISHLEANLTRSLEAVWQTILLVVNLR